MNDQYIDRVPPELVSAWQYKRDMDYTVEIPYWVLKLTMGGLICYHKEDDNDYLHRGEQMFKLSDGDWVVMNKGGHYWWMPDKKFNETYKSVPVLRKKEG